MSEHKNGEGGRTMKREKRKVALSSVQEEKKEKKESVSRSLWRRKERERGGGQDAACGTGQLAAKKDPAKHTLEEPVHKSKTPMSQNDSNQSCAGDWFPPKKRT